MLVPDQYPTTSQQWTSFWRQSRADLYTVSDQPAESAGNAGLNPQLMATLQLKRPLDILEAQSSRHLAEAEDLWGGVGVA